MGECVAQISLPLHTPPNYEKKKERIDMRQHTEFHTRENITIRVWDKYGNPVKLLKVNRFLSRLFGRTVGVYVDELVAVLAIKFY